MKDARYIIISPCRNEAKFLPITLESVLNQTVRPYLWVIVDDGSTDETPAILETYAEKHSFIKIIHRDNRGHRSVGPGVIEAFYAGYGSVEQEEFQFLCKLDLDLKLPPGYFEKLIRRMAENPRIGTCSGKPYFTDKKTGKLISEKCGDENSVGMTKFFRKECFKQIDGFVHQVMWDGIDGHRCRMLGWIACSWDEADLRFIHLRPMGSSQNNILTGRVRHGFGQYFMGTGFLYMIVSSFYRMGRPPYVIGGCAMLWGYISSWLTRQRRFDDREFRSFLRKYQWSVLIRGKSRATAMLNDNQSRFWRPDVKNAENI